MDISSPLGRGYTVKMRGHTLKKRHAGRQLLRAFPRDALARRVIDNVCGVGGYTEADIEPKSLGTI
jgi:hypothetical protein